MKNETKEMYEILKDLLEDYYNKNVDYFKGKSKNPSEMNNIELMVFVDRFELYYLLAEASNKSAQIHYKGNKNEK